MNSVVESRKLRRRARALNAKNKKHPKNAEKTGAFDPALNRYLQDNDQ